MQERDDAVAEVAAIVRSGGVLHWDAAHEVGQRCQHVLARIAARPWLLRALADEALRSTGTGESYPCMDKLVLWRSSDNAFRLRLHVFTRGYADRPHNHRWSFASLILAGSYLHTLYGSEDSVLAAAGRPERLRPLWVGVQPRGSGYFLDDKAVHSLRVDDVAVSLLLRGPAVKDRYFTLVPPDEGARQGRLTSPGKLGEPGFRLAWSSGAERESAAEQAAKLLTLAGAERITAALKDIG